MKKLVKFLNTYTAFDTIQCCCGHGKYTPTLIIDICNEDYVLEVFSNKHLEKKRNYYKQDKKGFYYIPKITNLKTKQLIPKQERVS